MGHSAPREGQDGIADQPAPGSREIRVCVNVAAEICRAEAEQREVPAGSAAADCAAVVIDLGEAALDRRLCRMLRDQIFTRELSLAASMRGGLVALSVLITLITVGVRINARRAGRPGMAGPRIRRRGEDVP
jgi:hypothetical protein